jgi:hypothetical protein
VNNERYKKMDENGNTIIKTKPRTGARRVLVTGGAGFVGSHLCDALVAVRVFILFLLVIITLESDRRPTRKGAPLSISIKFPRRALTPFFPFFPT